MFFLEVRFRLKMEVLPVPDQIQDAAMFFGGSD